VDLELNGTWECEPVVQLVVIGTRLECEGTLASLNRCIADQVEAEGVREEAEREAEKFDVMLRDDGFFEAAGREGCIVSFGLHESLEMRLQGIYATDLNSELTAFVNASPSSLLAYPSKDEGTGKVPRPKGYYSTWARARPPAVHQPNPCTAFNTNQTNDQSPITFCALNFEILAEIAR
jgi:hypothetical protein